VNKVIERDIERSGVAWCMGANSGKVVDMELAQSFAQILADYRAELVQKAHDSIGPYRALTGHLPTIEQLMENLSGVEESQ
jgi:hypothetical protein